MFIILTHFTYKGQCTVKQKIYLFDILGHGSMPTIAKENGRDGGNVGNNHGNYKSAHLFWLEVLPLSLSFSLSLSLFLEAVVAERKNGHNSSQ